MWAAMIRMVRVTRPGTSMLDAMKILSILLMIIGVGLAVDGSWYFVNNIGKILGNPGSVGAAHSWYYDLARFCRFRPVDGTIVFVSVVVATSGYLTLLLGVILYFRPWRDKA
jgi:hypothetical protein